MPSICVICNTKVSVDSLTKSHKYKEINSMNNMGIAVETQCESEQYTMTLKVV